MRREDRPRVDVTDVHAAAVWLIAEIGRPGGQLADVGRCADCRTLCWPDPDTGASRCLTAIRLAAVVDSRYLVVRVRRGEDEKVLFPKSAASQAIADARAAGRG